MSMFKWIKYSGASVIFTLNPLHWQFVPWLRREYNNEWPSPNEKTWAGGFLAITIRIWIDNGDW